MPISMRRSFPTRYARSAERRSVRLTQTTARLLRSILKECSSRKQVKEGKVRCEECAAKEATRRLAAYYRQGKAQQAADLQQHKVRYARHKALGRCTDCGKTVSTGKRLCLDCSLRRRRYDKRFFDAHRRVKTDFADGLCCKCNEPVVPEKKLCARHYAIAAANARKAHAQRPNGNHPWRHDNQLIFKKGDTQ